MSELRKEPCQFFAARFPQSLHDQLDALVAERNKNPRYRRYTKTDAAIELIQYGLIAMSLASKAEHSDEFKQLEESYQNSEFVDWAESIAKQNPHTLRALKAALEDVEKRMLKVRR